jgi:hypothetical protein
MNLILINVTQDLNMREVYAKMVPKNLNDGQKGRRNEVSAEKLEQLESEPDFLNRVITGDESWFFEYDPEILKHRHKQARVSKSKSRQWSSFFFYSRGVAHKEFVPPGVTMNQKYYLEIQDRLRKRVMQVRNEIADDWILRASPR